MDALVEKLGFLDYRDMLAFHKYILDAKQNGDYLQQARARTLSIAFTRMTKLKREQIENKVNDMMKTLKGDQKLKFDKDQEKLNLIIKDDNIYEHVFERVYNETVYDE